MPEQRKVLRPSAAAKAAMEAQVAAEAVALRGITHIEHAMTAEVKHPRRGAYWIKFGATITVQPDETATEARDRLTAFVIESIEDEVAVILEP